MGETKSHMSVVSFNSKLAEEDLDAVVELFDEVKKLIANKPLDALVIAAKVGDKTYVNHIGSVFNSIAIGSIATQVMYERLTNDP